MLCGFPTCSDIEPKLELRLPCWEDMGKLPGPDGGIPPCPTPDCVFDPG